MYLHREHAAEVYKLSNAIDGTKAEDCDTYTPLPL